MMTDITILSRLHHGLLKITMLTLIWLGFLGVRTEVRGGGGKITACLKLIRIMLVRHVWYISTHTYVVSENILFSTKTVLILERCQHIFAKNQRFLVKIVPLLEERV